MAAPLMAASHSTYTGGHQSQLQEDLSPVVASPRTRRRVFTICSESDEENTPRAPNPELSRIEAKSGLVSLTSQLSGETDGTEETVDGQLSANQRSIHDAAGNADKNAVDDDVVLVTDKSTQIDSTLFSQNSSSVKQVSFAPSFHQNYSEYDTTLASPAQQEQLSDNELINDTTDESLAKEVSEAPTLKVEYVGKVWDAYIDNFLLGCDHIDQAAIYDIATGKCIACSSDFAMSAKEFENLANVLTCLNLAYKIGVTINGRHYKMTLADGKRGLMARTDYRDGCSACRTRTLIIVALHGRTASSRICNEELMRLGDFFWAKGL